MESEGESGGKAMKNLGGKVCQICGESVGVTAEDESFVACDVCSFPVCRPCYECERNHGNQSCPQCKTRYIKYKGSPAILGDREEESDADADAGASDFHYPTESQTEKQKVAERMLSWQMAYRRGTSDQRNGNKLYLIREINPQTDRWTTKVQVIGKSYPRTSATSRKFQRLLMQDNEHTQVQASIFRADIEVFRNTLMVNKKYYISNVIVCPIASVYMIVPNEYQWTINSGTLVEDTLGDRDNEAR